MAIMLTKWILNSHEKKDNNFFPYRAKRLLEKLDKDGEMDARAFLSEIRYFYQKCESYLDVYHDAYKGVTPHLLMNSSEDLS